jgi:hypothetical protein
MPKRRSLFRPSADALYREFGKELQGMVVREGSGLSEKAGLLS